MKKASVEMLLLLSNVYSRKHIADLNKDLKSLSVDQMEVLLARLEEEKAKTFAAVSEQIVARLDERRESNEAADEISYLLLTRYKLSVPNAAQRLSDQLVHLGYQLTFSDRATKANFNKWLKDVCNEVPLEKVRNSAMSLRPPS
jgi:hypothetical protein